MMNSLYVPSCRRTEPPTQPYLLALHLHHDKLAEYINGMEGGLDGRRDYVRRHKPDGERRDRHLQGIPDEMLPVDVRALAKRVHRALWVDYNFVGLTMLVRELDQMIAGSADMRELHGRLCPGCEMSTTDF